MGVLGYLTIGLCAAWILMERLSSAARGRSGSTGGRDRLSLSFFWSALIVSIPVAVALKFLLESRGGGAGRIDLLSPFVGYLGCLVIVGGLVVRLSAIRTLGRQFTYTVSIVEDHRIVDTGIYRRVRHPSYLGTLLCLLGLGLALQNWISLIILLVVPLAAIRYRISVEEQVLVDHFGEQYAEYCRRTKRLIPGIY